MAHLLVCQPTLERHFHNFNEFLQKKVGVGHIPIEDMTGNSKC